MDIKKWFEKHVKLKDEPYFLDAEQTEAVVDSHKNTLVTARAGSGKTRVIVAKIVYLVSKKNIKPHEIHVFVFNRNAAKEINQRLTEIKINNRQLFQKPPAVATTFHKFALDILRNDHKTPKIINEEKREEILKTIIKQKLPFFNTSRLKKILNPTLSFEIELLTLTSQFINRAQQKYPGSIGCRSLNFAIENYNANSYTKEFYTFALSVYQDYCKKLKQEKMIDFNILMYQAAKNIAQAKNNPTSKINQILKHKKHLLIDEYQDFSYLFFNIIKQIRKLCPGAHLFAVGDDWQAINRFAGSDCNFFINFADYFPENTQKIHLLTNYRSDKRIVTNATDYMTKATNTTPPRITAFSNKLGNIKTINYTKIYFDKNDIKCDSLHDAYYQKMILPNYDINAAKLLKTTAKIIKRHKKQNILILHRHNFSSFSELDLPKFYQSLEAVLTKNYIMTKKQFNNQVSWLTIHRSKGLESDVVILIESDEKILFGEHKNVNLFEIFGDNSATNREDQHRLYYVAVTRAKHRLYLLKSS